MLKIKEQYDMEITDLSVQGQGIGRAEGVAVFIPDAVPGDVIKAEITEIRRNFAIGKLLNIITPSEYRIDPACVHSTKCGGCQMQSINYEGQLYLKKKWVEDSLIRIGGMEDPIVHDVIPMENPENYRNKAHYSVGRVRGKAKKERGCNVGFYRAGSKDVIDCGYCMLQTEAANRIAEAIRRYVKETKTPIYDERSGTGVLRHVVVRTAYNTNEVMVTLIATEKLTDIEWLVGEICVQLEGTEYNLESVVLNINKQKRGSVFGKENITLAGKPTIMDNLMGLDFEISPTSFYQTNPQQTARLYEKVKEYADLKGTETVLDLYCGVGSIGLILANQAQKVIGIETVKSAIIDANRNATINGIVNAEFIHGKAEEELPKLLDEGIKADLIILDPPRSGCDPNLLEAISQTDISRIIYVSCNPATLARDIKILRDKGYEVEEIQPVDMFPYTNHVETVVLMSKE